LQQWIALVYMPRIACVACKYCLRAYDSTHTNQQFSTQKPESILFENYRIRVIGKSKAAFEFHFAFSKRGGMKSIGWDVPSKKSHIHSHGELAYRV
jgi:hypothetical protein